MSISVTFYWVGIGSRSYGKKALGNHNTTGTVYLVYIWARYFSQFVCHIDFQDYESVI